MVKGRSCEPLRRDQATKVISEFYAEIGKPPPDVLFFSLSMSTVLRPSKVATPAERRGRAGAQRRRLNGESDA